MPIYLCPTIEEYWYPGDSGYDYCPMTGEKLLQKCPECEAEILKPEHKFCVKCGTEYRPNIKKKEKIEEEEL